MRVKVRLFGEPLTIPNTTISGGVNFLSVWVDGNGFSGESNELGAPGYTLLETPDVELGDVGAEKQRLFANLHRKVIDFDIKSSTFVKDGGIASISMTILKREGGTAVPVQLEFLAKNCKGVCLVSNALSFSCEMLAMDAQLRPPSRTMRPSPPRRPRRPLSKVMPA
jgi:hypothetical protein